VIALTVSVAAAGCPSDPPVLVDAAFGVCADGIDNDGDGSTDFPADPGCDGLTDNDEDNAPIAACNDGRDNDGDQKTDYPNDPGCYSPLQASELDDCPGGENCPDCGNGVDDDGDAVIDFPDDPGCDAASGDEFELNPNACGPNLTVQLIQGSASGTLMGAPSNLTSPTCGGGGGEAAFQVSLTEPSVLVATTDLPGTTMDTVLYLRTDCQMPATEITCNDDFGPPGVVASRITAILDPGTYYLVVDGRNAGGAGNFQLQVDLLRGEDQPCDNQGDCGPGLQCRIPMGQTEMVCAQPVCNDADDEDGDLLAAYPDDPGCESPLDFDEADDCPAGTSCPACANGVDDDGDGDIDYPNDPDCVAASHPVEGCSVESDPILTMTTAQLTGNTTGAADNFVSNCGFQGADQTILVSLPAMQSFHVDNIGTSFDSVLILHDQTCANELACSDSFPNESMNVNNLAAGTYAIVVDGWFTASGPWTINISGFIAPGGACDGVLATAGVIDCPTGYACTGGVCLGNLECNNGVDDDGDGLAGFPTDPGCASPTDTDESDDCPSGPNCPQCGNDVDDDGDSDVDYPDDPDCASAADDDEFPPACVQELDPIVAVTSSATTGSTVGLSSDFALSCGFDGGAGDVVLTLDLPAMDSLSVDNFGSSFDTVHAVFDPTCGLELGCTDFGQIVLQDLAAGTYSVVMDGWFQSEGAYTVNVSGVIAPLGACDGPLASAGVIACPTGYACTGGICLGNLECNNGVDDDGDTFPGYPSDPGCASPNDTTEADDCPSGPNCPQCSNDGDDDGDGDIDYPVDPDCASAADDDETPPACFQEADPIEAIVSGTITGSTSGTSSDFALTCAFDGGAGDVVMTLDLPAMESLSVDNFGSSFDTVHAVFNPSCGVELGCTDFGTIVLDDLAAGTYNVIMDGWGSSEGPYTVNVSGTIAPLGACDGVLAASGAIQCPFGYTCSGGICLGTDECNNGADDDGDGFPGYPTDPGCANPTDDDESDNCPAGPGCPQCGNDIDDDMDGLIDYPNDPSCSFAGGQGEGLCGAETSPITPIVIPLYANTTVGGNDDFVPCATNSASQDRTYSLTLPVPVQSLNVNTFGSQLDTVLSVTDASCTVLACNDQSIMGNPSNIDLTNLAAGAYGIIVDGWSGNGSYQLEVRGIVAPGTACTSPLFNTGVLSCTPNHICTAGTCQPL
jgi:hypothetical protein